MVLFVLRKRVLQTHMSNHPVGPDAWFLVGPFVYFHTSCANSEGSGETARMRRLARAFAGRLCDKYHNLLSWLILFLSQEKLFNRPSPQWRWTRQTSSLLVCLWQLWLLPLSWSWRSSSSATRDYRDHSERLRAAIMKLVQELRRSRQLMSLVSFPFSLERFGRGSVAWSDVCPTDIQEVTGLILQSGNILSWRLVMKSFL